MGTRPKSLEPIIFLWKQTVLFSLPFASLVVHEIAYIVHSFVVKDIVIVTEKLVFAATTPFAILSASPLKGVITAFTVH